MQTTDRPAMLDPAILVIFGITGDLSKRKLLPALYELIKADLVPEPFEIIGITRQQVDLDEILQDVELCINERDKICDPVVVGKLKSALRIFQMDLTKSEDYERLLTEINDREMEHGVCLNRLYYLSIPPQVFGPIVRLLGERGHNSSCPHGAASTRLLIEKPFGYDYASAQELINELNASYGDAQIFRIDHYLAKETVQNILTFRFENPIFEAVWQRQNVKSIAIQVHESIGIEGRVAFFEQTGALRDLIQSHLLQLLALVTMERPETWESDDIHAAKLAALEQIRPIAADQVITQTVRAQYEGYREEVSNSDSWTETFASLQLELGNERWHGVPITLEAGKGLNEKSTAIRLAFGSLEPTHNFNQLTMHIQPNEGITLLLQAKKPGLTIETNEVKMDFNYRKTFEEVHPDAYERVLVDAVRGDKTLFASGEEVLAAWRIIDAIVHEWSKSAEGLQFYKFGSAGPVKN